MQGILGDIAVYGRLTERRSSWSSFHVNIIHYGVGLWSDTSVNEVSQAPISKTLLVPSKQVQETQGFIKLDFGEILFWTVIVSEENLHLYSSPQQKLIKLGFTRHPLLLGRHWVILIMNININTIILAFPSAMMRRRSRENEDVVVDDELLQTKYLLKPLC